VGAGTAASGAAGGVLVLPPETQSGRRCFGLVATFLAREHLDAGELRDARVAHARAVQGRHCFSEADAAAGMPSIGGEAPGPSGDQVAAPGDGDEKVSCERVVALAKGCLDTSSLGPTPRPVVFDMSDESGSEADTGGWHFQQARLASVHSDLARLRSAFCCWALGTTRARRAARKRVAKRIRAKARKTDRATKDQDDERALGAAAEMNEGPSPVSASVAAPLGSSSDDRSDDQPQFFDVDARSLTSMYHEARLASPRPSWDSVDEADAEAAMELSEYSAEAFIRDLAGCKEEQELFDHKVLLWKRVYSFIGVPSDVVEDLAQAIDTVMDPEEFCRYEAHFAQVGHADGS